MIQARSQKQLQADLVAHLSAEPTEKRAPASETRVQDGEKRVAVFAVHGISPIQQYSFQDQVAAAFQSYLNARETIAGSATKWDAVVHWPRVDKSQSKGAAIATPSALRIYRHGDDPENPTGRVYDVYEGYWSPYSKGKTNIAAALRWLINATFLGTSSTARIPCTPSKLFSDISYVAIQMGLAAVACALALGLGLWAWQLVTQIVHPVSDATFWSILTNPIGSALNLPPIVYVEFAIAIAVGYAAFQLFVVYRVSRDRDARSKVLLNDARPGGTFATETVDPRTFHRLVIWILWFVLGVLLAAALWVARNNSLALVGYVLLVAISIALLQYARAKADFAVEDVLGDVQIYTTHDSNSTFYSIRGQIIGAVAEAFLGVLRAVDVPDSNGGMVDPYYGAIHVVGHSLGSTVAMDMLIRLRQLIEEDALAKQQWRKIRSFTTFGTALEKTRFFFDVRQPTLNAAQDQWENDVYGCFFTDKKSALEEADNSTGIYWSNHWYFRDIVANAIVSYASDVPIGNSFVWSGASRPICENFELPHERPRLAWVHSDYLGDTLFWANVGPILTT